MRKIFLSFIVFFLFILVLPHISFGAERYATCDACGLCPKIDIESGSCAVDSSVKVPGDWSKCVKCMYNISSTAPNCQTVLVKADNSPAKPLIKGRQFTMLGCLTSGSSVGFNTSTGASSFVQAMLNVIFSLAGGLAFFYLMYGGYIILTSEADPEKLNYGRRLLYGAGIGLIITIGSVFIVNFVGSGILKIPGFNGATGP